MNTRFAKYGPACVAILSLMFFGATLQAGERFIIPGIPRVDPNRAITQVSFDHLIPKFTPVLQPGDPTVNPNNKVVNPIGNQLVPTGPI